MLVSSMNGRPSSRRRSRKRTAPGIACSSRTSTPSMSISHASGCRQFTRPSVFGPPPAILGGMLELTERGAALRFSFDDVLRYHGGHWPGGAAIAYKVLERALPELGPCERREIEVATAFGGPGARDAFELVTRAVTGGRYRVTEALERPERGRVLERFAWELSCPGRTVA